MAVAAVQYQTGFTDSTATVAVTLPAAPTAGNLLIAWASTAQYITVSTPAGWTPFSGSGFVTGACIGFAFYKIATAGDQTTTFTASGATTTCAYVAEYSGAASASASFTGGVSATTITWASTVPSVAGSLVLEMGSPNGAGLGGTVSTPAGYTAQTPLTDYHSPKPFILANPAVGVNAAAPGTITSANDYVAAIFLITATVVAGGAAVGNAASAGAIGSGRNPSGAIGNG